MSNNESSSSYTVHVVAHTHWDREWYATFQHFRMRLVRVMDRLLDLLERDPSYTHFNLDGQTIVLQDYLEIRPEKRPVLESLIQSGRLAVGPWYILPDEFLVSGESIVRNLLLGHRIASEFGRVQKAGYIPDTFGHISQLPQIFRGFGIGDTMHFRGLDERNRELMYELWWESPDGSRILLRHLPNYVGYAASSALPEDVELAASDMEVFARGEIPQATTSHLLVLNGVDHLPVREDLPEILMAANAQSDELRFVQSSLEEYFAALLENVDKEGLEVVYGELRDTNRTPGHAMIVLTNILSSRIYNKQQNERAQTLLERWAEPWSALLWTQGERYPGVFLWKAWEWLLKNHPHDSIGGCSVDQIHAQMETRFEWATEIGEEVTNERFHLLASQMDLSGLEKDEVALILFNGLPWDWDGVVTTDIDLWRFYLAQWAVNQVSPPPSEAALAREKDAMTLFLSRAHHEWSYNAPTLPDPTFRGLQLRPLGGEQIALQMESISKATVTRPLVTGPSTLRDTVRVRAAFRAQIPAYGYQVYAVRPQADPNPVCHPTRSPNVLENDFLRAEILSNGSLSLTDKTTGHSYTRLGYFEDGGDAGDGYNYSFPAEDRVYNSLALNARISRLANGPAVQRYRIDYEWALPVGLSETRRRRQEETVSCPLSMTVSLGENSRRLDLEVTFDNRARDHRLRMLFPSDIISDSSHSDTAFDVTPHSIYVEPVPREAWAEDAPTTYPQQSWVDLSDGQRGLCVITRGLPEYEVLNTERREIAITLLRAVGYLGASKEIQTIRLGAGPNMATPEGQIQRKLTFNLALRPHAGTWDDAEVWRDALDYNVSPRAITYYPTPENHQFGWIGDTTPSRPQSGTKGANPGTLYPPRAGLLRVEGHNAILSALKKSDTDDALILRLYNPSQKATQALITLPFPSAHAQPLGLDEQPIDTPHPPQLDDDGRLHVPLPAKKIVTLRVEELKF
ncbi:MAG: alpha-mannosidase [Ardenticatenaceae bacterium]